jgi:ribonuclease HII
MLFAVISEGAVAIGIGQVEAEEVDRLNVYWAAMEARRRAVDALPTHAAHILVDGKRRIADAACRRLRLSVATLLAPQSRQPPSWAKVTRDALMTRHAQVHPEYGFDRHKGYATANHLNALRRFGPLSFHRHSYAPVWIATGAQLRLALWDDGAQASDNPAGFRTGVEDFCIDSVSEVSSAASLIGIFRSQRLNDSGGL